MAGLDIRIVPIPRTLTVVDSGVGGLVALHPFCGIRWVTYNIMVASSTILTVYIVDSLLQERLYVDVSDVEQRCL